MYMPLRSRMCSSASSVLIDFSSYATLARVIACSPRRLRVGDVWGRQEWLLRGSGRAPLRLEDRGRCPRRRRAGRRWGWRCAAFGSVWSCCVMRPLPSETLRGCVAEVERDARDLVVRRGVRRRARRPARRASGSCRGAGPDARGAAPAGSCAARAATRGRRAASRRRCAAAAGRRAARLGGAREAGAGRVGPSTSASAPGSRDRLGCSVQASGSCRRSFGTATLRMPISSP